MPSQIKTNHLTVYLIKPEFQQLSDIVDSTNEPVAIPGVGDFIYEESHTHVPEWVTSFFGGALGNHIRIFSSSAKGLLLVKVPNENTHAHFALSFGTGRHLLREGVCEERFGLKVVLNSAKEDSFRSIDKTVLGAIPKHSREQMSRDVAPADFGIDIEQDLISSVTAISLDSVFGNKISGKDALTLSAKIDASNVVEILTHCLARYKSQDYRSNFGWIDQISEVRNKLLSNKLDQILVERINRRALERIWMAVPDVINWSDTSGFRYQRPKRGQLHDDIQINTLLSTLEKPQITIEDLKGATVFAISAQRDDSFQKWSALRCLYAECESDGKLFILNNGKWYEVAREFTEQIENGFRNIGESTLGLPEHTGGGESAYNISAANALADACCMDQNLIMHGGGHNRIEFCDLLTAGKAIVHVKKYGGSSVLNHLFSQGVVSGELFVSDESFRQKLNEQLPVSHKLVDARSRPDPSEYEIVYAIISNSPDDLDIPFFSKVSLCNAKRRLSSFGYRVTKKKIFSRVT